MSSLIKKITEPSIFGTNVAIGQIVKILDNGSALIQLKTNKGIPISARSTVNLNTYVINNITSDYEVVVVFENGDLSLPIIVGVIADSQSQAETVLPTSQQPLSLHLDRKQVALDAADEIVLRCGKSSISLFKDGRILLRGINIISKALESNKLKGGTVSIN